MSMPQPRVALAFAAITWGALMQSAQDKVNPDAALIQEFEKRAGDYMKIRKAALSKVKPLKPTNSPGEIKHHEKELAHQIREARSGAGQGAIFTPPIGEEFRRLTGMAMKGSDAVAIRKSLKSAEPVRVPLRINGQYPEHVPLQ